MAKAFDEEVSDQGSDEVRDTTLKADVSKLKADLEKLARDFSAAGGQGYGTARRAARAGVEQLRSQSEATIDGLRGTAQDLEAQLVDNVREKPITALAIAAGVGYLFALLSSR